MLIREQRVKSVAAWLIIAAFCGLIGFSIVYHYASHERPSEHFAIVIDAGSTQTRSSLYRITVHVPELADWTGRVSEEFSDFNEQEVVEKEAESSLSKFKFPLSNLLQVRQVSSCVNGGPLASISSASEAGDLIRNCLLKFTKHIKLLDFMEATGTSGADSQAGQDELLEADEVSRQLALTDHRVNSVTHMYLGATAGMRALEQVNGTRAGEKLRWVDEAISRSNELILNDGQSPYVNKGFVGIIEGSDEASFGWISVNFVCDTLAAHAPQLDALPNRSRVDGLQTTAHQVDGSARRLTSSIKESAHSIGTLELGGASAQMAFQMESNRPAPLSQAARQTSDQTPFQSDELSLFGGQYRMATRSDLCLGMSQAVLRLNYIVLHRLFGNQTTATATGDQQQQLPAQLELTNACVQRGARIRLTGQELAKVWQGACLLPSTKLDPLRAEMDAAFRRAMTSRQSIGFIGTGQTNQCDLLLNDLIEPVKCRRHFALCPSSKNIEPPPAGMPFVTISGYNHALNVLGIEQTQLANDGAHQTQASPSSAVWQRLGQTIDNKLGGSSISYIQLLEKTSEFCSTNSSQLLLKYPKVNKKFQNIICIQLVYIRKLLTDFYRFDPASSWSQIKFLIFAPKSVPSQFAALKKTSSTSDVKQVRLDARRDIGWTLGLLLNATSHQLSEEDPAQIHFHHGASIMYITRTTILLMLACCLIAIGLLVAGVIEVERAQNQGEAYISQSSCSSSSYDVSHLSPTPPDRHTNNSTKPTGLKYVLSS